ncbi:gfo/Idh/MocA family oxidoreductase [Rathayibacter rathayi]|uniref:Gfo/Idh/MocA family oxidoreductase n=1 Tax=Rathayibacter rathayi TaxID=33887 RepID=A0ABD6W5U7_RATRA|nr:Gfo/Idh/MocA family oxidoreductase [Rathayibacter rathayi]AZZ50254.1 gfo/Idh/MocA family oxidoreductase [Rathayibacter rathayi]MWV74452.1 gfo/Idh/MocA family oxidoreductase [Rathayibacter rathayi NCPPB 2980 = VKM Ac-1601]PPF10475.1 gfo/Idh/MocA family oxidoreductase [Rathayibacter rathayi]PPF46460.1 gfo/Idh/MocA family oxidoreductase [Rathayibacter rathayi]PPF76555.1 gfo/Idh/MocA family oxidoreductase [Rathayibacter rathayi]
MSNDRALRVAMVGTAFMGRTHSHAWRTASRFFPLPLRPELAVLVGSNPDSTAERAERLGWSEASTEWRAVIARDDIDLVDICTPGDTHAEIAIAALEAGKHVLCEKPLANSVEEAERMVAAAAASGTIAMCGFSYRRTPALALAKRFIGEGRLGDIRHVRAQYLQDWLSDSEAPLTWRLQKERAGSGALGDIGAHSIDTAQWLTGRDIRSVSATLRTFTTERPVLSEQVGLGGHAGADAPRGAVTVDDAAAFTAAFEGGALGVFEATRVATGRRNANRIEVNGELGSIAFDFERMNELEYYDARDPEEAQGFRRIQVTEPAHPYMAAWWPTGHGIGYEHLFTHQVVDLIEAIAGGTAVTPTFADALDVQRVLDAVATSAAASSVATPVPR